MGKSVLIATYDWSPSADVGAVRVEKIARALSGHDIIPIILTTRETNYQRVFRESKNFSFPIIRTRELPSPLTLYKYLKNALSKTRGAHDLLNDGSSKTQSSSAQLPSSQHSYLKRFILSMLFTPDEFQGWLPFAVLNALTAIKTYRISHVITSGPPFSTHLVGLAVKKWKGDQIKWIADCRDPWVANEQRPELVTTSVSNYFNRLLEKQVILHADRVVCVTSSMTDWYRKRYPSVLDRVWETITNGFEQEEFNRIEVEGVTKQFTISYIGSIEYERNPLALLLAVAELCRQGDLNKEHVRIRFVGRCDSVQGCPTANLVQELGLQGVVDLVGSVPRSDALREMKSAQVLLLLANAQRLQVPGKAYEYIAAGAYILAVTEEHGATADLLRRVGGGAIVAPDDHQAIKRVLLAWYKDFLNHSSVKEVERGPLRPAAILDEYEWNQLGARYAELLH